jgi:hypothetical protein
MRRLAAATVIVLALAASGAAAPASARTLYNDCMQHLRFEPATINVFCADGGLQIRHIHWSSWHDAHARGSSTRTFGNDCKPNCAQGHFHRFHVRVLLRRPNACPDGSHVFTRVRITFLNRKWFGHRRFTQSTICPSTG